MESGNGTLHLKGEHAGSQQAAMKCEFQLIDADRRLSSLSSLIF